MLRDYLVLNGGRYWPSTGDQLAEVTDVSLRRGADPREHRLHVRLGSHATYELMVWLPVSQPISDRPQLSPPDLSPQAAHWLTYQWWTAVEEHFTSPHDPQLGAPAVLDHLRRPRAIILRVPRGTSLRRLLTPSSADRDPASVREAVHNAGRWLRRYHAATQFERLGVLRPSAQSVGEALAHLDWWLRPRVSDRAALNRAVDRARCAIADGAVDVLPMAARHGAFVPSNVIVEKQGRVVVTSSQPPFSAPTYEDLASFLVAVHRPRRASENGDAAGHPRDTPAHLEAELLRGYFGDHGPSPEAGEALAVFRVLMGLDRWADALSAV